MVITIQGYNPTLFHGTIVKESMITIRQTFEMFYIYIFRSLFLFIFNIKLFRKKPILTILIHSIDLYYKINWLLLEAQ